MVIVSTPAPMATSAPSCTMAWAAIMMAWEPEEQKRFTVVPATSLGKPAAMAATRAVFMPWQPSGKPQPTITSSISMGSRAGTRSTTLLSV